MERIRVFLITLFQSVSQNRFVRIISKFTFQIILTFLLITAGLSLLTATDGKLGAIDDKVDDYVANVMGKSVATYATIRVFNGVVSVIKDSDVEGNFGGGFIISGKAGADIGIGQLLDPLDDMIERVESVLVASIISIGILKVVHSAVMLFFFKLIAVLCFAMCFSVWIKRYNSKLTKWYKLILVMLVVARFCLPFAAIVSDYVYSEVLKPSIDNNVGQIDTRAEEFKKKQESLFDFKAKGFLSRVKDSTLMIYSSIKAYTVDFVDTMLNLIVSYVALFLIQVVAIPLFCYFLLKKSFLLCIR